MATKRLSLLLLLVLVAALSAPDRVRVRPND